MSELLYLIGPPGAGKTTVLDAALAGVHRAEVRVPFARQLCSVEGRPLPTGVVLGGRRAGFGGTDVLPMNVQPKVVEWLAGAAGPVVGEGDRLGNAKFFEAARALGWRVTVAYLCVPEALCDLRRAERGSAQNAAWMRGRRTKVERLAAAWTERAWWLDGCASVEAVAAALREHPVIRALRGEEVLE